MHICFLEGDMSRQGGTERMTALLANRLTEHHQVQIISLSMAADRVFFPLAPPVTHTVLAEAGGKLGMLRKISQIRRILKRRRIDCVVNVDTGMGIYGILAAAGLHARVITWEHANYFNNWNSRIFPRLRRFAARHSDAVVVLTQRDKENYETHIPSKVPVHVIPNPAERAAFAYNTQSRVILSAGALLPIKGYDRVIEVGKVLFARHPDWQWQICGEGPERPRLEQAISAAGLEQNILLCGAVRDMEARYRGAAVFVLTSHMEGLPMVLLEAKAHGLPLVSFDIMTGPGDIIRDGVNGWLVPADDTGAMAERLLALMEREDLRRSFSQNSQLDMDKFDPEVILKKWEEIFVL